jgi:adenylylsulfate kinase-like enzyme
MDRPNATGVMLTGEKGSGKTLLTKNVCMELAKQNIPTIVINAPWKGDKFNSFIQSIEQPCAVLFDEFEKTYDRDDQEKILTLLDGVFPSKKLFLLTCNDKWRVDYHMRNRPGRIYYMLDFKGVDGNFIREYCADNLNAKNHIERIVNVSTMFKEFNFDMLKALCEEMNRFNETPQQALAMLNAKPEFDGDTKYEVKIIHDGKEVSYSGDYRGNPLSPDGVEIGFDPDPESDDDFIHKVFTASTLVTVKNGQFVFEDKGTRVMLTRKIETPTNYWDAF